MIQDESIKAIKNKITGIYETNIKTFDKNIVFISISKAKSLLELNNNMYSGLMIENINNDVKLCIEYYNNAPFTANLSAASFPKE